MRNADWVGNTISIGLFAVLAVASWGLSEILKQGWLNAAPGAAEGPNAIVESPRIIRTDATGLPQYRLEAKQMSFEQQADRSILEQPVMTTLASDRPKTVVQSDTAVGTNQQNQVELIGNVRISREAFGNQPAARVTTSRATLFLDEERAMTDAPVLVQRGTSTLQGIGMRYDQKTQRIDIVSESRMVVPKESK
jgi:lipopolysaccharide export system protein LptC